jgi:hypothetical protein
MESHCMPTAPVVHTVPELAEAKLLTQWPAWHCGFSAHGCPISPAVQKPSNEPLAHLPAVQSESLPQGSPIAPDEQRPFPPPITQRRPAAHSSCAEHALPALPSVQVPEFAPAELLLQ